MSNKSSQLDYIPTLQVKSYVDTFHPHFTSDKPLIHPSHFSIQIKTGVHLGSSEKYLAYQNPSFQILDLFRKWTLLTKCSRVPPQLVFFFILPYLQVSALFNIPIVNFIRRRPLCLNSQNLWYHGNDWTNYNFDCSRHVGYIWYSRPYHTTSPQTSAHLRSVWLSHLLGSRFNLTNRTSFVNIGSSSSPWSPNRTIFIYFIKTTGLIRPLKQLKMQLHYKRVQT